MSDEEEAIQALAMTVQRRNRSASAGELFDDDGLSAILEAARADHERAIASGLLERDAEPTAELSRASFLAERSEILLAGAFGQREVDRCRSEDPGSTQALDHARAFAAQQRYTVLILVGGTGSGKTTAATWLAREIGGRSPGMIDSTELERRGRYDHTLGDWLADRTLTVIDDFGVEPMDGKGYFRALVDGIANRAYKHRRRMVITTNIAPAELKERLGDRIWSRVIEAAGPEGIAECGNADLRRLA